ncbi:MAG: EAL domain-containing protein [Mesorhizobium sp.]|nr:EAL domain-containing protein [Mesorhizobium sp.]
MLDMSTNMPVLLGLAGLALLLFVHVWRSERRIADLQRENGNLARSIDAIMRSPRRGTERDYVSQADLGRRIREELSSANGAPAAATDAEATAPEATTPPAGHMAAREAQPASLDAETIATILAGSIAEERLEISLQPIVSVSLGQSMAFDILTSLDVDPDNQLHVKRIAGGSALDPDDFDMSMFLVTVDTARRRLGSVSERMKLHLALSEPVLKNEEAVADICALVGLHPGIARSIVLSLPPQAGRRPDLTGAVRTLYDAGFSVALDSDGGRSVAGIRLPPLDYIKVDARLLIAIADGLTGDVAAQLRVRLWPDGCPPIIALGVETEETAMRLIDLGIDLMAGDWFSAPRRMHQTAPAGSTQPETALPLQG